MEFFFLFKCLNESNNNTDDRKQKDLSLGDLLPLFAVRRVYLFFVIMDNLMCFVVQDKAVKGYSKFKAMGDFEFGTSNGPNNISRAMVP